MNSFRKLSSTNNKGGQWLFILGPPVSHNGTSLQRSKGRIKISNQHRTQHKHQKTSHKRHKISLSSIYNMSARIKMIIFPNLMMCKKYSFDLTVENPQ